MLDKSSVRMAGVLCACIGLVPAMAQPFNYRVIADNTTTMPGSSIKFGQNVGGGNFFAFPSTRNGRVSFWGAGIENAALREGIYEHDGVSLKRIADTTTNAPDSGQVYLGFTHYAYATSNGTAFVGSSRPLGYAVYSTDAGTLNTIATRSMPAPGSSGNFSDLSFDRFNGNTEGLLFGAAGPTGQIGLYQNTAGVNTRRVDSTTPVPNHSGTFSDLRRPTALRGGSTVFAGYNAAKEGGLYRSQANGDLSELISTGVPVPGLTGKTFTGFHAVSDDDVGTIFRGEWGETGVEVAYYSLVGSSLTRLFGVGDAAPQGPIVNIRDVSGDSNRLAIWEGGAGGGRVLLREADGTMVPVIKQGDLFDGKLVDTVSMGSQALDGDTLALYITFAGAPEGIYTFTVPAPGAVGVLGLAGLAAARRRRA